MNMLAVSPVTQTETRSAEHRLVERFRGGDPGAFDEIVAVYHERVARVACRLLVRPDDVDDVVQDVFLRVLQRIDTFRAEASFSTWLISITVNRCRSQRRRQVLREKAMSIIRGRARRDGEVRRSDHSGDIVDRVREAIARLPASFREPVVLRYQEGFSIQEISEVLKLSTNAVERRLSRARQQLKMRLTEGHANEPA